MTDRRSPPAAAEALRQRVLSRWDDEGGAAPDGSQKKVGAHDQAPPLSHGELIQMRVRVIALENLVMALLAEASPRQIALARRMAAQISSGDAGGGHPLTARAAAQMENLLERAGPSPGEGAAFTTR